ncbi:hypothetical protein BUN12_3821 [Bacillus amyloliquefaciens]|nr:hypothetical protein S101267_00707 [Bacillus amyloliquefaciens]AZV92063.1 hypothetical protein BUN12_3821 [Bacillus amyloliquefaciens]MDR4378519.1 hypothetical protein [Bacillus amyloliquefaciens]OBR25714.1 hypothetical protein SRCM101266_03644 [Bacillus amyloliquefaciens]OXL19060.1 hypothetical protein CFI04_15120 [Bacillus amyloliquefaciens]
MILLRFISLMALTVLGLVLVANYASFLALPIYIIALALLILLVIYLIYHYSRKIIGREK